MTAPRVPTNETDLFSSLLAPAHGHDLDPADLDRLAASPPAGHTTTGWRAAIRRAAAEAREAFDEGRHGDARQTVRQFCENYAGELDAPPRRGPRVDDLTPDQLASHIARD